MNTQLDFDGGEGVTGKQHIPLMEERLAANCRPELITFRQHIGAVGGVVTVPTDVVSEWKDRLIALQGEIAAYGLCFEAVISNPALEPWKGGADHWVNAPKEGQCQTQAMG